MIDHRPRPNHAPTIMPSIILALKTAMIFSLTDTELSDAAQRDVPTGFKGAALNLRNLSGQRYTHYHDIHVLYIIYG